MTATSVRRRGRAAAAPSWAPASRLAASGWLSSRSPMIWGGVGRSSGRMVLSPLMHVVLLEKRAGGWPADTDVLWSGPAPAANRHTLRMSGVQMISRGATLSQRAPASRHSGADVYRGAGLGSSTSVTRSHPLSCSQYCTGYSEPRRTVAYGRFRVSSERMHRALGIIGLATKLPGELSEEDLCQGQRVTKAPPEASARFSACRPPRERSSTPSRR
jgi:hypothetical protein